MARTLSAALLAAQQAASRTPAIRILINGVNYSSRLLLLEHREEPYRDEATIVLNNSDRGLYSVSLPTSNLMGYRFRIAYGYYTGEIVAEPNGDGAGNEYVETADLWVKTQQIVSEEGHNVCILGCQGQWYYLREQRVMATLDAEAVKALDPAKVTNDPYFKKVFDGTMTVYQLIESVLENAIGWTLNAVPATNDGIIAAYKPVFTLEELPYAGVSLRKLIMMTKCYLRPKANLIWEVVYPQTTDLVNETYYSGQSPFFTKYGESMALVIPNRPVVFAGNPKGETPWPTPVIIGDTGAYTGNYVQVMEPEVAPAITTQTDADNRASVLLTRHESENRLSGSLIAYHDSRVELYDKVNVIDSRGT